MIHGPSNVKFPPMSTIVTSGKRHETIFFLWRSQSRFVDTRLNNFKILFFYLILSSVLLPKEQDTRHRIKRQFHKQLHVCRQSEKAPHILEAF